MSEQFEKHKAVAVAKFGDKYDYSKFSYTTRKEKSTIGCPLHGEFEATIYEHGKSKYGCPECAKLLNPTYFTSSNFSSGLPDFVKKNHDFELFAAKTIEEDSVVLIHGQRGLQKTKISAKGFIMGFRSHMGSPLMEIESKHEQTIPQAVPQTGLQLMVVDKTPSSFITIAVRGESVSMDIAPLVYVIDTVQRFLMRVASKLKKYYAWQ